MDTTSDSTLNESMTPPLRATAIVGFGSVVTLGLSVVTAKAYAVIIGPEGVGLLALMLGMINVAIVVASVGVPTSVIRWLSSSQHDGARAASIRTAASTVAVLGGLLAGVVLVLARDFLAAVVLGAESRAGDVVLLAIAVAFGVVAGVQIGILNGGHRVASVTGVNISTAAVSAAAGIGFVGLFGVAGLAPALVVTYLAQAVSSRILVGAASDLRPDWRAKRTALGLVTEGAPLAASQLASAAVLLIVPLTILQLLGSDDVGQFRAASTISTGYLSFFLAALTQDFLPRIANITAPGPAIELTQRRMRLVLGVAIPIILGLLALGPWLVEWLYSAEFTRAFDILKWFLVGDLIRLPAWVLGYLLIARARPLSYLGYELGVGIVLVSSTLFGIAIASFSGVGVAYAVTQLIMYGVVWWIVRTRLDAAPGRLQAVVLVAALLSALTLVTVSDPIVRLGIFGVAAVGLACVAWPRLYHMNRVGSL